MTIANQIRGTWVCFFCNRKYPNTLLYCPKCNIARKHSRNLQASGDSSSKRKGKDHG